MIFYQFQSNIKPNIYSSLCLHLESDAIFDKYLQIYREDLKEIQEDLKKIKKRGIFNEIFYKELRKSEEIFHKQPFQQE